MNNAAFFYKLAAVLCALLFLAIAPLPYGYYTFLRIAICVASAIFLYAAWSENNKSIWVFVWGGIAILFNPIIPIHLSKEVWGVIDIFVGMLFAYQAIRQYKFSVRGDSNKK
ncbi:MAG: DUF6804 family protein [Bdellovibrionales bacterium]